MQTLVNTVNCVGVSRVKNTDQAEEVATVIYAVQSLKKERNPDEVSEQDLFNYILDWKKVWKKDEKKKNSVPFWPDSH